MNNEFGLPNQLKTTLSMKKYQPRIECRYIIIYTTNPHIYSIRIYQHQIQSCFFIGRRKYI